MEDSPWVFTPLYLLLILFILGLFDEEPNKPCFYETTDHVTFPCMGSSLDSAVYEITADKKNGTVQQIIEIVHNGIEGKVGPHIGVKVLPYSSYCKELQVSEKTYPTIPGGVMECLIITFPVKKIRWYRVDPL